jgi:hypothetical protein
MGEASAFAGSGLTTVQVPLSVEMLWKYSFSDCTKRHSPMTLHLVGLPQLIPTVGLLPHFWFWSKCTGMCPICRHSQQYLPFHFEFNQNFPSGLFIENAHDPDSSDSSDECGQ